MEEYSVMREVWEDVSWVRPRDLIKVAVVVACFFALGWGWLA